MRTSEDALTVLRQASQPLGPMGADWLAQQERRWTRREARRSDPARALVLGWLIRCGDRVRVVEGPGGSSGIGFSMGKGTILVVTAMDARTVVLRSRAGRYRLGAWSDGHQRHPAVGVGSRLIVGLTSARHGPTMVRSGSCACTAALYALKAP